MALSDALKVLYLRDGVHTSIIFVVSTKHWALVNTTTIDPIASIASPILFSIYLVGGSGRGDPPR